MARQLVIQGTTYNFPDPSEDPNWGAEVSDWAEAVTDVLSTFLGPGDILQSTATIANNQSVAASISGLIFDPAQVRAANVTYSIYRTSASSPSGFAETGTMYLIYDNNASSGNKWILSQRTTGNSGVVFSVTDLGQIQYTSSNLLGGSYSGTLKFSAKTLAV